jgi:catechol 2,3-dioxygenase-like lactoylglutathione lyase family enzyme
MKMSVNEVVPFLAVKDMEKSIAFYTDGLGFQFKDKWVDDGVLRWCHLQIGSAGLMLQQFKTESEDSRRFGDIKGEGVTLFLFRKCHRLLPGYQVARRRGVGAAGREWDVGDMCNRPRWL